MSSTTLWSKQAPTEEGYYWWCPDPSGEGPLTAMFCSQMWSPWLVDVFDDDGILRAQSDEWADDPFPTVAAVTAEGYWSARLIPPDSTLLDRLP
jgi:hypothetical protein